MSTVLLPQVEQPPRKPRVRLLRSLLFRDPRGRDLGRRRQAHPGPQDALVGVLGLLPGKGMHGIRALRIDLHILMPYA